MLNAPLQLALPAIICGTTYDPDGFILQENGITKDLTDCVITVIIHDGTNIITTLTSGNGLTIVPTAGTVTISISSSTTATFSSGSYSWYMTIIEADGVSTYRYAEGTINIIGIPGDAIRIVQVPIDVATAIKNSASKITPADSDYFAIIDSAANWALKKLSLTNLKAVLKTYFDEFYGSSSTEGTTDHSVLTSASRALADQHPIAAITGLATQLATTIPALITKGDGAVVWVTTTGAFSLTVPAWANVAYISGCAAGGGGNASHGLGGGGGQSINRSRYSVTGGATISGSIGTGGAGATSYNASPASAPGGNGGKTVITGVVTLYGGYGGGNHPLSQWYGGAGGGAGSSSGMIRGLMNYSYGGSPASVYNGGRGGDSLFGTGGGGGYYPNNYGGITSVAGGNGIGYGGGGGGGGTDSNTNVTSG